MTREEAQHILLAYRPGLRDHEEPEVSQALEVAERDPELQAWLQAQALFHKTVRAELRRVEPPATLPDRILARSRKIVPLWRRPELLLAAACLAAGLVIAAFFTRPSDSEETFAGFRSRMVGFALRLYRMDIVTNDLAQVRHYLRVQGAPADYALTPGLQQAPVKGGAFLTWQGHPVAMVCFGLPEEKTLFMFVVDQAAVRHGSVPGPTPVVTEAHGVTTASWTRDGQLYLVAAAADRGALEKLLGAFIREAESIRWRARACPVRAQSAWTS